MDQDSKLPLSSMPSENDPVLGREGSPLGYLTLGMDALAPSNVGSFLSDNAPDMSGIAGLAPSRDTLSRIFYGLEAGGAALAGRTPLYLQQQQMDLYRQQLGNQAANQREVTAARLMQQEEQKQQRNVQLLEQAMKSPNAPALLESLGDNPNYSLAPQAKMLLKSMKDTDYSSFEAYRQFIPQDVQDRFVKGTVPYPELKAWMDHARKATEVNAQEIAKANIVSTAMNKSAEQRTPYEAQLVEEKQAANELKQSEGFLKTAQALKALSEAERGPVDHSVLNRTHQAMFGKPYEQGTADTQSKALDKYFKGYAEGRRDVTGDTPVGQSGKAQEFRDPVTGKAAPSWATPSQLQQLGFINIEPTQGAVVNQLTNADASMKEILAAGNSLLRKDGGSWFEIPKGMLQTPLVELIKKYKGDPNAAVLQSAINRIAPTLSRLGGDVANIAVAEREMYINSIFSPADTLESFAAKIKSIEAANARTRQAMGFLPDEQSYIRQLVIRGYTDEQIKATLGERKRYQ